MHARHLLVAFVVAIHSGWTQAETIVRVVMDITPTKLTSATYNEPRPLPTAPSGDLADTFSVSYDIVTEAPLIQSLNSWKATATYALRAENIHTPFFDSDLVPDTLPTGRPWRLSAGRAEFAHAVVRDDASPLRRSLVLGTGDGFDSLGIGNYSPSWIFFERRLRIEDLGPLTYRSDMPNVRLDTDAIAQWLEAKRGHTFTDAFEEALVMQGGAWRSSSIGDVTIRSVTVVPEASTSAMYLLGLAGLGLSLRARRRTRHLLTGVALAASAQTALAQAYTIKDLGVLDAWAINDHGQIAGSVMRPDGSFGAFYTGPDGEGMTILGAMPEAHRFSTASHINNLGQILGSYETPDKQTRYFMTAPGGSKLITLDHPVNDWVASIDINHRGEVISTYLRSNETLTGFAAHSVMFNPDGSVGRTLTSPDGDLIVSAINVRGEIVGQVFTGIPPPIFSKTRPIVTGPDGNGQRQIDMPAGWVLKSVSDINDKGSLLGSVTVNGAPRTFYAERDGSMRLIDLPNNETTLNAFNDAGQIVGRMELDRPHEGLSLYRAVVTGPGAQGIQNLDELAFGMNDILTNAVAINNRGDILVHGMEGRSYLLTPVPEVGTLALMALGLMALAWVRQTSSHRR